MLRSQSEPQQRLLVPAGRPVIMQSTGF